MHFININEFRADCAVGALHSMCNSTIHTFEYAQCTQYNVVGNATNILLSRFSPKAIMCDGCDYLHIDAVQNEFINCQ